MSLGPVMLDIQGTALTQEDRELLKHPATGGVILFSRNYESVEKLNELIQEIHNVRQSRLLVAVDHEGGRVQRFRHDFTPLPAVALLGEIYKEDRSRALDLAEITGWLMAVELRSVGVDFSFAPVLDLKKKVSNVIGDRAFHRNPTVISELATAYMTGMQTAGMAAVGKHFPGHGSVKGDSHHTLPEDDRDYQEIVSSDLQAFKRMVRVGIPALMPAHVVYTKVDNAPACFSSFWLNEVLRQRMGFQGAIISDDLSMAGAEGMGSYPERAGRAIEAGCDMILVCNNRPGAVQVVEHLKDYDDPVSHMRLVRLHGRRPLERVELQQDSVWQNAVEKVRSYDLSPMLDMDD